MDRNKKDLISIMRYIVCQDETTIPLDVDWEIVWNIAQRNHLEAIVFKAMPENIACQYRKEYFRIVSRSVQQNHLLLQIEDALEKAGIPYALQKGSILKNDYPDITLRFMSDIDLYIQPEYRSQIRTAMESIDGKFCGKESGDEQFVFLIILALNIMDVYYIRKLSMV